MTNVARPRHVLSAGLAGLRRCWRSGAASLGRRHATRLSLAALVGAVSMPAASGPVEFKFEATYFRQSSGPVALTNAFGIPGQAPVTGAVWFEPGTGAITSFTIKVDDKPLFVSKSGSVAGGDSPTVDSWIASSGPATGPKLEGFELSYLVLKVLLDPSYYSSTVVPTAPPDLQPDHEHRFYIMFGGAGPHGQLEGTLQSLVVAEPGTVPLAALALAALLALRPGSRRRSRSGHVASVGRLA